MIKLILFLVLFNNYEQCCDILELKYSIKNPCCGILESLDNKKCCEILKIKYSIFKKKNCCVYLINQDFKSIKKEEMPLLYIQNNNEINFNNTIFKDNLDKDNSTENNESNMIERNNKVNLTESNLTESNLTESNLTESNLTESNLTESNLTESNLTEKFNLYDFFNKIFLPFVIFTCIIYLIYAIIKYKSPYYNYRIYYS
jgi:hypothetical protein